MKDKTLAYLMQAGELLAEKPRFPSKRKCQEPKLTPVLQFVNLSWEQEQTVENDMSRTSGGLLSLYLFWHPLSLVCKWATLFWTRRWSFSVLKVAQAQHPNLNSLLQRCGCRKWFALTSLGIICCVGPDSSHRGSRASCYPGVRAQVMSKSISVSGSPRGPGVYNTLYTRL